MIRTAILTVSDRASSREYNDATGPAIVETIAGWEQFSVSATAVIPDDAKAISNQIIAWVDDDAIDVVLTNGGTGISPRDVTPEATTAVIDAPIPGISELMRLRSLDVTDLAALSRAVAGRRGSAVVVNLPGSTTGAVQCVQLLPGILRHAIDQIAGRDHK